ncbi:MAG: CocE/NonD family hydrolase [Gemmatimonadetes bacterium]|nr:CocE/NonD family hydrolase [Gemmatimonadota bacterium]
MKASVIVTAAMIAAWVASATAQSTAPYDAVLYQSDVMVPMRDGVKLAIDIYRPARGGQPLSERLPVLLQRTPYSKTGEGLSQQAKYFASHGYVVAVMDTRGRYKSEGVFSKYYEYDAYDGYDTIEWLAKLPYAQAAVGMWGTSYGAHTQADAAKLNPPSLKTLVLNMGGLSNGWEQKVRSGGAFELGQQLGWAFGQLQEDSRDPVVQALLAKETVEDWFAAMPLRKGLNPLSVAPNFEDYVLEMITRSDYDEYWKELGVNWVEHYDKTADIPMIHISGWYDTYAGGTIDNYVGLSKRKRSPRNLLMGPWTHGGNGRSFAGSVDFGPEATLPGWPGEFHLRWFDHYLKGKATGVENMPAIRLFVMGTGDGHKDRSGRLFHGGYWRDETAWPLTGTRFTKYYFHADASLRTAPPAEGAESTTFLYDPRRPVPTIGGSFSGALPSGAYDQREHEDFYGSTAPYLPLKTRSDVVVFQTEPLTQDVEVVGPIVVTLYASSSAVDTDFTAKLIDVYPPSEHFPTGFDMNLTDDIIRARYRNSPERQELMQPGRVYTFTITPFPTANVFKRGHRIRVDISSSNFPRFDVNPNTGEPLGRHRGTITANNTIYHGAAYPSHIELPIVATKR